MNPILPIISTVGKMIAPQPCSVPLARLTSNHRLPKEVSHRLLRKQVRGELAAAEELLVGQGGEELLQVVADLLFVFGQPSAEGGVEGLEAGMPGRRVER